MISRAHGVKSPLSGLRQVSRSTPQRASPLSSWPSTIPTPLPPYLFAHCSASTRVAQVVGLVDEACRPVLGSYGTFVFFGLPSSPTIGLPSFPASSSSRHPTHRRPTGRPFVGVMTAPSWAEGEIDEEN